jgi:hypothetical protein
VVEVRWVGFVVGIALLVVNGRSVLRSLVVPRPPPRSGPGSVMLWLVRWSFRAGARRLSGYLAKDRLLAWQEPTAVIALLATWLAVVLVGYALVLWPITHRAFGEDLVEAGSSMFTLGFVATRGGARVVDFVAAATGLVIVALVIAYLPALYSAFSRREALVTMLESRAGAPAWGPEILVRHQLVGINDGLPGLYAAWEQWAADVAETHTTYPSLIQFRSPHAEYSWVIGLLAVLDSAALCLALSPSLPRSQARLCLRMGFSALRDVARVSGILFDPDPDPDSPIALTEAEFMTAVEYLRRSGFPIERDPGEAWPQFRGWRVNYESIAYALADLVVAPPALWSGPRSHLPPGSLPITRPEDRRPRPAPPHPPLPPPIP